MTLPVLPIFPEGSLSESVTTTVWIGVFVLALGNLRFGWTLSGLVTPGYLVPLMIVKPVAALVIWGEGILSYLIVLGFSAWGGRTGRWSNFFGRDRFFALVLTSIGVRVALDGYLLPYLARTSCATWLLGYDRANDLHSFGLIIVSLIANQFWKPGLLRGLPPLVFTVFVTYLIVRGPLMLFTNFNIGSLEYMYEDIASSMLASPKAYMILVITAFIASRLNLYYSWDFNGILIPSLLALQWYEPLKVLTSFIEAWTIYLLASLVLRLPMLKESTVEGARKILLFFNISFAYKLCMGHVIFWIDPALQASEFFGFGYLLPSLIALKMHDKGIPARLTRTTLQASIAGAVCASLVGFSLTLLPQEWRLGAPAGAISRPAPVVPGTGTLLDGLREEKISMYGRREQAAAGPVQAEIEAFSMGMRALRSAARSGVDEDLARAGALLRDARYELVELEHGVLHAREMEPRNGWGAYFIRRSRPDGLLVEVPAPLDEWATPEAAALLFELLDATALAIATSTPRGELPQSHAALSSHRGFFHQFHRAFGGQGAVQIRAHSGAAPDDPFRRGSGRPEDGETALPSKLWVRHRIPDGFRLAELRGLLAGLEVEWGSPRGRNIQRDASFSGFAELFLSREDLKKLLARLLLRDRDSAGTAGAPGSVVSEETRASLEEWVFEWKTGIADRGTNLYVPATLESLLFVDEEIVKPLIALSDRTRSRAISGAAMSSEVDAIHVAAAALGYGVLRLHTEDGGDYLVLRESPEAFPKRFWGAYVFRLGRSGPFAVEVPHPLYEMNTLEYAVSLFERLSARILLMAGTHPKCNMDGSADVVLPENESTLFNLVNQAALREPGDDPFLVVQVRALGPRRGVVLPEADALLALSDAGLERAGLTPLTRELTSTLDAERLLWKFVDGSPISTGYEARGSAQSRYLIQTRNKEFAALWLAPFIRLGYRQSAETSIQSAQLFALGIETAEDDLHRVLESVSPEETGPAPAQVLELLEHYHSTQDINVLHAIQTRWPDLRLRRILDRGTRKAFLVLEKGGKVLPAAMSLTWNPKLFLRGGEDLRQEVPYPPAADRVRQFIRSGALFLVPPREIPQ